MKKIIMLFLVLCVISACGNHAESKENDSSQESATWSNEGTDSEKSPAPHGVAPVIYYHGKYFWIAGGLDEIPAQYIDSGDKILGIQSDDTLPTQECYGSNFVGANTIGHIIYIDPDDEDSIIIMGVSSYGKFVYYGPLEEADS